MPDFPNIGSSYKVTFATLQETFLLPLHRTTVTYWKLHSFKQASKKVSRSHGGEYEDGSLLGYNTL
jgi:hypothetical protein